MPMDPPNKSNSIGSHMTHLYIFYSDQWVQIQDRDLGFLNHRDPPNLTTGPILMKFTEPAQRRQETCKLTAFNVAVFSCRFHILLYGHCLSIVIQCMELLKMDMYLIFITCLNRVSALESCFFYWSIGSGHVSNFYHMLESCQPPMH